MGDSSRRISQKWSQKWNSCHCDVLFEQNHHFGFIMVARAVWFEEDEYQLMTFGVGLCLVTVGVAMMIIVNVLKKCVHDAIISHLENQVQNAKRFRDNTRLLGGTNVPEDKQILVQASNLV